MPDGLTPIEPGARGCIDFEYKYDASKDSMAIMKASRAEQGLREAHWLPTTRQHGRGLLLLGCSSLEVALWQILAGHVIEIPSSGYSVRRRVN